MSLIVRADMPQEYTDINALFVEVVRFHTEALPEIYRPTEEAARLQAWVEGILADPGERCWLPWRGKNTW